MKPKGASIADAGVEVEKLITFLGRLTLILRMPAGHQPGPGLSVTIRQGEIVCSVAFAHWMEIGSAEAATGVSPGRGRRFLATLPDVASRFMPEDPVEIELGEPRAGASLVLHALPLMPADLVDGLGLALAKSFAGTISGDVAAILAADVSIETLDASDLLELEHVVAAGNGLVLSGWMANFAERIVHVCSEDLQFWLPRSALQAISRPDIHAYLREKKRLTIASDEHGFACVLPSLEDRRHSFYLVEVSRDGRKAIFHGPIAAPSEKDETLALEIVGNVFGDIRSLPIEEVDRIYRPLLSTTKGEMRAQVIDFGPAVQDGTPLSSIIIPFYGDAFFLNCVHYLQRALDEDFELVLVVDDPRIWNEIYDRLSLCSRSIRVPTRLLRNFANYGYAGANNLGANLARGDVLFLMNSDILVKDATGLKKAAEAIRERRRNAKPELIVGFSLLYEDNTIQHAGIAFIRSSAAGDLFLADHPLKGLPFAFYEGDAVKKVPAVTGALMALSKELFANLDGFDRTFERGDFEDADLCLRARKAGVDIELHVHPGLYHLERQSVPAMGHESFQSAVNYMNCAEFNRRWGAELARPKRMFKISGGQAPSGAAQ